MPENVLNTGIQSAKQHNKRWYEEKVGKLVCCVLGKKLNGTPPPLSGRQVATAISAAIKKNCKKL